jgi:hypothetical protein
MWRLPFYGELLTEVTMSALVRRRAAKTVPKNTDLQTFLKVFGVRRDVLERAVRHPSVIRISEARRQPARRPVGTR